MELLEGSAAIAESAIVAGCRFFAGYPMSPFTGTSDTKISMANGVFRGVFDVCDWMSGGSAAGVPSPMNVPVFIAWTAGFMSRPDL